MGYCPSLKDELVLLLCQLALLQQMQTVEVMEPPRQLRFVTDGYHGRASISSDCSS